MLDITMRKHTQKHNKIPLEIFHLIFQFHKEEGLYQLDLFTAVEQLYLDLALGGPDSLLGGTGHISAY